MTDSYTVVITHNPTGIAMAAATVEIDASGARLTEVRAEPSGELGVPETLADLDFSLLIRTARILSSLPSVADTAAASEVTSTPELRESKTDASTPKPNDDTTIAADDSRSVPGTVPPDRTKPAREQRAEAPADFGVMYWRLGSISKVAKHYDIPHHVAQDWIKSLQQQGKLANPWPSRSSRSLRPQ